MTASTLLIPALFDAHWPLLQWAFESPQWHAVVLDGTEGVEDLGLRHVHNDLCYPFVLITGQVLSALQSGRYDPARTAVLISQAGDACRGSCLIRLLRPVLDRAGFAQVRLLSLNVRDIERDTALPVTSAMLRRAAAAVLWGDALMLLRNQTRPYEAYPGETDALRRRWMERLSICLRTGRGLDSRSILRRCREMAADFRAVPTAVRDIQKIAVVGDIYTKYCRLGNWDLETYLAEQGCEMAVGGLSWYALYYMDTHLDAGSPLLRLGGQAGMVWLARRQEALAALLREAGFTCPPPYPALKAQASGLTPVSCAVGSGWLLSAETAAWVRAGYPKVLATMPFGCLPGHVYARGQFALLQRSLPGSLIVGVDYDASTRSGTVESRVRMLLDTELSFS
ncbi:hypothetical protein [uncultured Dysosmobacter sp.]|uniref:hypothetical protein n=1 Tax=uncultured Dysosmobacter sp. TaxID=2591384 RepID=UPI002637AF43|nr:hypothetical protein [uncultured Dysosmobacter sp.]